MAGQGGPGRPPDRRRDLSARLPFGRPPDRFTIDQIGFLAASLCVIAVVSLGVHDVMLTRLHVPYPHTPALLTWASYVDVVVRLTAFVWFARAADRPLHGMRTAAFAALGGLCLVMLNETFRVLIIEVFLTAGGWSKGGWLFTLVGKLPAALTWFCHGAAMAVAARRLHTNTARGATVLVVAALGLFALQPILAHAAAATQDALREFDLPQRYNMPFPLKIYIVIYVTFIESAIAAMAIAALAWPSLTGGVLRRMLAFTTLLLCVRGRVVSFLLFSFWVNQRLAVGFLSESQFFLETALLGLLSAAAWSRIARLD